ncbi:MAG TPA: DUF72 domain-containing protein [Sphingomonadaceae bacterium]|nr:DUF72 domain-containing protein [Sphingomonadaceae bacterium]
MGSGRIRVGIGGWTYEPWRGAFYPPGLPHARELAYAAERLGTIEINGTYYRLQKPETFAGWAKAVPDDFVFTVKASRFCTNRRVLAEAGEAVERFLGQGLTELGAKLGPILWQLMPTKAFDPQDFGAFLKLLPARRDGMRLRHAIEVRHESFRDPAFTSMAREANVAIVFADSSDHPQFAETTADFVYARLQDAREAEPTGYAEGELDRWADVARCWAEGGQPAGFAAIDGIAPAEKPRDAFLFMINGAKVRAPAAAQALIARLG